MRMMFLNMNDDVFSKQKMFSQLIRLFGYAEMTNANQEFSKMYFIIVNVHVNIVKYKEQMLHY